MAHKHQTNRPTGWLCLSLLVLSMLACCQECETAPPGSPGLAWQGIVPGVSTEADVLLALGDPRRIDNAGEYTIYAYPSYGHFGMAVPNRVVLRDGRVRLVRFMVTERSLRQVLEQYGEPEKVTWSPSPHAFTRLFIIARHGVAVVAQNQSPPTEAFVFEKWYFEPMALSQFLEELAPLFPPLPAATEDVFPEDYWVPRP